RLGRAGVRAGSVSRRMAGAGGRPPPAGPCDALAPTSARRSRPALALRRVAPVITLVVEASTYAGSVALLDDGALVVERSVAMRGRDREALMPAVAEALDERGVPADGVGRVVCGAGPGSFTSLRIAAGIAKGLAFAVQAPL